MDQGQSLGGCLTIQDNCLMCGHQLPPFEIYAITMPYRSKLSYETLLVTFTLEIFDSMASGKQTDVAVMDFSKAFDKVDHQRIILKLKRMGINNITL
jgi:hypothetical protein